MADPSDHVPGIERRIVDALQRLLRAREPGASAREPADMGAVRPMAETLDRWVMAASMAPWFRAMGADEVAVPGAEVELTARLGRAVRLRASRVQFEVGGAVVGEAPILPEDPDVRLSYVAGDCGRHRVVVRALDAARRVVAGARAMEVGWLEVVGRTGVVAVSLFSFDRLEAPQLAALDGAVRPWVDAGYVPCYLAGVSPDAVPGVRGALERAGLPPGVVLTPGELDKGFADLGVDFRGVFAETMVRRARARGVPVVVTVGFSALGAGRRLPECWNAPADRAPTDRERAEADRRLRAFFDRRDRRGVDVHFRLAERTGAAAVGGHAARVVFDGRKARERILACIEGAARYVHLQTYIFRAGRVADEIAARLVARARHGVRVRLLVDGLYGAPEAVAGRFGVLKVLGEEPGIEVKLRDPVPVTRFDPQAWKHRDHRKILVVDGAVAWVGGRNVGDEYFTDFSEVAVGDWTPSERIPWLDAHVEVEGPAVAVLDRAFVDAWIAQDGSRGGETFAAAGDPGPCGDVTVRVVLHDGLGDGRAPGMFEALFDAARETIYVLNDFPVTNTLADALFRARRRGVRVVFLTGSAVARRGDGRMLPGGLHRELFEYMTKERFEHLLRHGVEIFEYVAPPHARIVCAGGVVRPYVHAKVVVVDGRHVSVGSANLDATASYWEREANVVIHDRRTALEVQRELDAMLARAVALDPEDARWRAEAGLRRIARAVWPDRIYS